MYVICTLMFGRLVAQDGMLQSGVSHRHWWNQRRQETSISDLPATSRRTPNRVPNLIVRRAVGVEKLSIISRERKPGEDEKRL